MWRWHEGTGTGEKRLHRSEQRNPLPAPFAVFSASSINPGQDIQRAMCASPSKIPSFSPEIKNNYMSIGHLLLRDEERGRTKPSASARSQREETRVGMTSCIDSARSLGCLES